MIRTAALLIRTSPVSVLFLAASLMTLATVLSEVPAEDGDDRPGLAAALVPSGPPPAPVGDGPAASRIALFDPERRAETVSGSIDDLRGLVAAPPAPANVAILGVLLQGAIRKVMLGVGGEAPAWSPVGAEVGGWRVASIDAEGAVLERDERSVVLKIADRLKARMRTHADAEGPVSGSTNPGAAPPESPAADPLAAPDPVEPSPP